MTIADLPHLARRFFRSIGARGLSPTEQRRVAATLEDAAARLYFAQAPMDQAHGLTVAETVSAAAPGRRDLFRAALLHDVGKSASGLRVSGRTVASLLAIARLPVSSRMRRYLDHGPIGAAMLDAVGESDIVVAFARDHRSHLPPRGVAPDDWATLRRADQD